MNPNELSDYAKRYKTLIGRMHSASEEINFPKVGTENLDYRTRVEIQKLIRHLEESRKEIEKLETEFKWKIEEKA